MSYQCKIVADSLASNGCRLTTFEVTYPLIIHAEIMTHRVFSRNVASNRAIPVKKLIDSVQNNPFVPEKFPKNQAGMQSAEWIESDTIGHQHCLAEWLRARNNAVDAANHLMELGVHKQITNRLLAPFLWTTAVITATEWNNFFSLRCNPMAQPEIQKIAYMMRDAYQESIPKFLAHDQWHMPYITEEDSKSIATVEGYSTDEDGVGFIYDIALRRVSIARCARVSYLTQNNERPLIEDLNLYDRLASARHLSPLEHVARPSEDEEFHGNFRGWKQYRKFIEGESGE
jgi:thymidylate synthase ThyX